MPKLSWENLDIEFPKPKEEARMLYGAMGRGWFYPDPDSVMWWCFNHFAEGSRSHPCSYEYEYGENRNVNCDCGLVAMPTRLKEEAK